MNKLFSALIVLFVFSAQAKEKVLIIETVENDVASINEQGAGETVLGGHGQMVRAIINRAQNLEGYIVEGNLQKEVFWQAVDKKITDEKIKYVNMSFAFLQEPLGAPPPYAILPDGMENPTDVAQRETKWVRALIKSHPDTLFIAASGNGLPDWSSNGFNLDGGIALVPAGLSLDNIIAVGAVGANDIVDDLLPTYKMTFFSNYGIRSVDLLAAGENFVSPVDKNPDGSAALMTGTSFAAPYVFLGLDAIEGSLAARPALQRKEVLLKSVYIPNVKNDLAISNDEFLKAEQLASDKFNEFLSVRGGVFPVKSGGIVDPERAAQVAAALKADPSLGVDQAVFAVENASAAAAVDLQAFWKARGI